MTVKLVLLKSNEEVIADVKDLVDENDKPIFVVLENPYCCKLIEEPVMLVEGKEESETKLKEYQLILENAKKEVAKIHFEAKNILDQAEACPPQLHTNPYLWRLALL